MAIHINNRRFVKHPLYPVGESGVKEVIDYFVDTPADFNNLPGYPEIAYTSTAFCPSTGEVKTLMLNGWEAI
jgi:hypothetical protein